MAGHASSVSSGIMRNVEALRLCTIRAPREPTRGRALTMNRFDVMYRLGFAPWERRDVERTWQPLLDGPSAPAPGRALDVGCGSGRDAVYLAKQGWQVTGVDSGEAGLSAARPRAQQGGREGHRIRDGVSDRRTRRLSPCYC